MLGRIQWWSQSFENLQIVLIKKKKTKKKKDEVHEKKVIYVRMTVYKYLMLAKNQKNRFKISLTSLVKSPMTFALCSNKTGDIATTSSLTSPAPRCLLFGRVLLARFDGTLLPNSIPSKKYLKKVLKKVLNQRK